MAKILFFDDIFSETFRSKMPRDVTIWDDNWVSAVEKALIDGGSVVGTTFEIVKSGNIAGWRKELERERPDIVLLDLFWTEEAIAKYGDSRRGCDISLSVIPEMAKAYPDLPIICYTVKPERDLLEKAYRAGATFFLEKVALASAEVQSSLVYVFAYFLKLRGKIHF